MTATVTSIYGLLDPDTLELRYIGKTSRKTSARLRQHVGAARKHKNKGTHCNRWVNSLLEQGKRPILEVFDTVDGEGEGAEIAAIGIARSLGCKLTNHSAGGAGQRPTRGPGSYLANYWAKVHAHLNLPKSKALIRAQVASQFKGRA